MKRKFNISCVIVRKYLITKTQDFQIKINSTVTLTTGSFTEVLERTHTMAVSACSAGFC